MVTSTGLWRNGPGSGATWGVPGFSWNEQLASEKPFRDEFVATYWAVATAPERYGSTVCFIDSSHAPYWSRPAELAALLAG